MRLYYLCFCTAEMLGCCNRQRLTKWISRTLAQANIAKACAKQKRNYDRSSNKPRVQKGDRVMLGEIKGKSWKLARRVVLVTPANAEVVLIDKPAIFVSLKRVRP